MTTHRFVCAVGLLSILLLCHCSDDDGGKSGPKAIAPPPFAPTAGDIAEHNRGVALMGRFDYSKAREVFAALTTKHPTWWAAKIDLGIATLNRQDSGDSAAALALFAEVLKAEPANLRARYCSGLLRLHEGHPREAMAHFEQVAKADPRNAYAKYYAAQCQLEIGSFAAALKGFKEAVAIDPYLRSGYYGAFQCHQRLADLENARLMLNAFEQLKGNPQSRLAELKYTRMGPLGEVRAIDVASARPKPSPTGKTFADPAPLPLTNGESLEWAASSQDDRPSSITACDINSDSRIDLFITQALLVGDSRRNAVLIQRDEHKFEVVTDHPLAEVNQVNAVLWGDYDNDGLTDAYLLRSGENQLWRQSAKSTWKNVTASTKTEGDARDSVDGAMFDADHDGDLDLFVVNSDGHNELFNNNLDGTFRPIAKEQKIAGDGKASRQVIVADLDNDRDVDIVVVNDSPPHEVYFNDRLWIYRPAEGFDEFTSATMGNVVAADLPATGNIGLHTSDTKGNWLQWRRDAAGKWITKIAKRPDGQEEPLKRGTGGPVAVFDINGDGEPQLVTDLGTSWTPAVLDSSHGVSIVYIDAGKAPMLWAPGPGRHDFATLSFSGKDNKADQMRSNRSGIGVSGAARIGARWTAFQTFRNSSGPGQSLQPIALGTGGAERIDFVQLTWPDGVLQTEMRLAARQNHAINETQRQLASCPIVFAWDGEKYAFVSDILGVGGIGFNVGNGEYGPPRPWENLLFPHGLLRAKAGRFEIKIGEPMEETCYLDSARLVAYDLPPQLSMTIDERFAIADPQPTGDVRFFHRALPVSKATNGTGNDVTATIQKIDGQAAPVGKVDTRFLGRLENDHVLTLDFDQTLQSLMDRTPTGRRELLLVIDGWLEYPYSQTMFSAWQAGATYNAPTLMAKGRDSQWQTVIEQWGFPAGMPRQMSLPIPLDKLPPDCTALRLTTNDEVYWDRIIVVATEPNAQVQRTEMPLLAARVASVGFANRTTGPQRLPHYDYQMRSPLWDTRAQSGWYTKFGSAKELVSTTDNAVAVIGPGEEVHFEFDASLLKPLAKGWTRRFVLESTGWCKDMDLYTKDGDTVGPMPYREGASPKLLKQRDALHQQYNTRYRSGH